MKTTHAGEWLTTTITTTTSTTTATVMDTFSPTDHLDFCSIMKTVFSSCMEVNPGEEDGNEHTTDEVVKVFLKFYLVSEFIRNICYEYETYLLNMKYC